MKKKIKKSEQKIADCDNIYDMIEILQSRIEEIETEHMQLIREIARLQGGLDTLESRLPDED
jgi:cell division protein FtsB